MFHCLKIKNLQDNFFLFKRHRSIDPAASELPVLCGSLFESEPAIGQTVSIHCCNWSTVDISAGVLRFLKLITRRNVHSHWTSIRVVINFPVDIFAGAK